MRDSNGRFIKTNRICNIKGCNNKHYAKGLCRKHYLQENKEHIKERQKRYNQRNKEKIAMQVKQYCVEHKKKIDEYGNQYRQKRRKHISERVCQYQRTHKEERAEYRKQWAQTLSGKAVQKALRHNRRALIKGLTKATVQRVYEDNIKKHGTLTCVLCFKHIEFGKDSLEHLTPLSRGGNNDYENLGIAHLNCNIRKHTMTIEEWVNRKLPEKQKSG